MILQTEHKMEELNDFIANYMRIADFRSVNFENPVRFKLQPDNRTFIMAAAFTEPSFSQTPFNVLWICCDPSDTDFYGKLWRRASADKNPTTPNKKYTWVQITDALDIYSEDQYYDLIDETPSWDMGLSWAEVSHATNEIKGLVLISSETDGTGTKAVLANDLRLEDKRTPTEHDHNDFPRTMVHIAGSYLEDPQYGDRVNDGEIFVRFSVAKLPTAAGQVFKLTHNNPSRPNEWFGKWSTPTLEDFTGEPATLVSANPYTDSGNTNLSDNAQYQLHVDSLYSDNNTIVGDVGVWSISPNAEGITIHPNTGVLSVPDISSDTVLNVMVTTTDKNDSSITAQGSISLNLRNTYEPIVPTSIAILGPSSVNEKNGTDYELQVFYSDGSDSIEDATSFMSSDILTATITNAGAFDAKDIVTDTSVTLTATFVLGDVTLTATKDVLVIAEIKATGIEIVGPTSMNELTTIELEAVVSFTDGSSYTVDTSDVTWGFVQTATGISATPNMNSVSYTSSEEIGSDETFTVKVSGTFDGVYQEDLHDITVKDLTVPAIPVLLEIIGADSIGEGDVDEPYSFQVTYDNSVSAIVNALPGSFQVNNTTDSSVDDAQVDPNNNIILGSLSSISDIDSNVTVTLSASYFENGATVNATKSVLIIAEPAKPQSLVISGPTELNELDSIELQAHAQMDDASSLLVSGSNSSHNVVWSFVQSATGIAQSQSTNAQTFTSQVDVNADETFIVEASVTIEGVTVTDQYTVQLKDVPLVPVSLAISGPISVNENTEPTYMFIVTWSDGNTTTVTPSSAGTNNGNFSLITNGDATVGEFTGDTTVTLNATFTQNGETVSDTLDVIVLNQVVPQTLTINGPTEIQSDSSENYTFSVTYSDGNTSTVTASTFVSDNNDANISGATVTVGNISSDGSATLTATYVESGVTLTDTHAITLKAPAVPQSIAITGPTNVNEDTTTGYTFVVTYSDTTTRTVTPNSAGSDQFQFDETGQLVVPSVTSEQTVNLNASYTEAGVTVTDTHIVTVADNVLGVDRVEVTGTQPNPYYNGDAGIQLTAIAYYDDGSSVDITNTGTWELVTAQDRATISQTGFFTPNETIPGDSDCRVSCSPQGSNKAGNIMIYVLKRPPQVTGIRIVGVSSMLENTNSTFAVEADMDNGDVVNITSSSTFTVASGSSGTISGSRYTAPEVSSNVTHTIKATYGSFEDTHDITVTNVRVVQSIEISGPTSIEEGGNTAILNATVTYDDATTAIVTTTSAWGTSNPSALTVNTVGTVTSANDVSSDVAVTIDVSYTEDGVTVTDTHVVNVTDAAPSGVYGPRWGTIGPQATGDASLIRSLTDLDESFLELLDKPLTGVDGEKFLMRGGVDSYDNPDGGFAPYVHNRVYVAYPASLGWARFVDDINNAGGMDGATAMPDENGPYTDSAGTVNLSQYANNGGIQVTIGGEDYIIYAQFMSSNNADYEMTITYGGTDRRSGVL
jgi:hypothetical protein